ncbi:unnamed protein product [Vitrella brassicaformis CCMP3155]|uniref:non-specific serine/threonine protein kinase n=1 Tax=Vitrella brassicaformis (strain CCMP3155) TaxID=1169540 RepID=A0A0G4F933_VITBC|nr:unnamed protein product [Vitrella brassicaformis CCMP3155]|eukprot:CEM08855.1 unnamed protein product [Vitrella brassicaformis CCMP3155]
MIPSRSPTHDYHHPHTTQEASYQRIGSGLPHQVPNATPPSLMRPAAQRAATTQMAGGPPRFGRENTRGKEGKKEADNKKPTGKQTGPPTPPSKPRDVTPPRQHPSAAPPAGTPIPSFANNSAKPPAGNTHAKASRPAKHFLPDPLQSPVDEGDDIDLPVAGLPSPKTTRQRLTNLINDMESLKKNARMAIERFASGKKMRVDALPADHQLSYDDIYDMVMWLLEKNEIGLPVPMKDAIERVCWKYDVDARREAPLEAFQDIWRFTLCHIRDTHFPLKMKFKREVFVGQAKYGNLEQVYKREEKLGQGQFGLVFKVRDRVSGHLRCCKSIAKSRVLPSVSVEQVATEITILRQLDHPNIVRLNECFEDQNHLYLIFELIEGYDLLQVLLKMSREGKSFSERKARRLMRSVMSALAHCHSRRVMHKDLAPNNIMILKDTNSNSSGGDTSSSSSSSEGKEKGEERSSGKGKKDEKRGLPTLEQLKDFKESNIKVIDFGLSEMFIPGQMSTMEAGTPYYMAPEVFRRHFNYKCDVWSGGILLYLLLTGHLPFDAPSKEEFIRLVASSAPPFPDSLFGHISDQAVQLLSSMLDKDVNRRPTASQVLSHPWFALSGTSQDPVLQHEGRRMSRVGVGTDERSSSLMLYSGNPLRHVTQRGSAFVRFAEASALKRICLNLVAMHLGFDAVNRAPQVFTALDTDHDGLLSSAEFGKGLRSIGVPDDMISKIVEAVDHEGRGHVGYTGFIAALLSVGDEEVERNMWNAFRQFDVDNDGVISRTDLQTLMRRGGLNLEGIAAPGGRRASVNADQILNELDTDKDGKITFEDFCAFLRT